jgi:signal peptidase I
VPREPVEGGADSKIFLEKLPGDAAHLIAELGDAERLDDTDPVILPAGHYFMLGDNRDDSRDSRISGPISRDRIVSRVFYVYWSWDPGQIGRKPN